MVRGCEKTLRSSGILVTLCQNLYSVRAGGGQHIFPLCVEGLPKPAV